MYEYLLQNTKTSLSFCFLDVKLPTDKMKNLNFFWNVKNIFRIFISETNTFLKITASCDNSIKFKFSSLSIKIRKSFRGHISFPNISTPVSSTGSILDGFIFRRRRTISGFLKLYYNFYLKVVDRRQKKSVKFNDVFLYASFSTITALLTLLFYDLFFTLIENFRHAKKTLFGVGRGIVINFWGFR